MNRVLTIVVTYNGMEWIDRCLSSLVKSSVPTDVYVIDNLSIDGTPEYVRTHFPNVIFFQNETNLGFGKGNNIGLQYALDKGYEFVYLLNQDAWVMPDTFEKLIRISSANFEYGILSPMHLQPNMSQFETCFDEMVCSKSEGVLYQDQFFDREKQVYTVSFVQAAHWMITRECLIKIGGFSPTFPHYGEDDNYCERVLYHGYKIGIVPSALAIHDADAKKPKTREQVFYRIYILILHDLSNVLTQKGSLKRVFIKAILKCRRYHSFIPMEKYVKALLEIRTIRKNVELSKGDCAFLSAK